MTPQRYCTNCGAELPEGTRFCGSCGKPTHETAAVATPETDVDVPPPPDPPTAFIVPTTGRVDEAASSFGLL